jgi:hypothetical protein
MIARDGDVLVVSYPEVSIPIGSGSYCAVKIGGLIYTRKLVEGDDVSEQYDAIYTFLQKKARTDGREKITIFQDELKAVRSGR